MYSMFILIGCPFVGDGSYEAIRDGDDDGYASVRFGGTDCDDTDVSIHPGQTEVWYDGIDQNCDGRDDDQDGDGAPLAEDCDDTDPRLRPGTTFFVDVDGDGFGGDVKVEGCVAPPNTVADGGDCDDTNAAISPLAEERCDAFDRDCDGDTEAGAVDAFATFIDDDGDGFGDQPGPVVCTLHAGLAVASGDCDDADPHSRPGLLGDQEVCDGFDNDCDGHTDDEDGDVDTTAGVASYLDFDLDGYGDPASEVVTCVAAAGRVTLGGDCNDGAHTISPGAEEICDGIDNDCDFMVDVGASDAGTFFVDADGDGFGSAVSVLSCDANPPGVAAAADDCDDTDPSVRPGALEVCGDGILQDCNVTLDDCDGDGTPDVSDCRPNNAAISPTAVEVCDGLDNDCDGLVDADDPDAPNDTLDYFLDHDGDGFGSTVLVASAAACTAPANGVANTEDCDDGDPTAYPGNLERCDGVDNDCNDLVDDGQPTDPPTFYRDLDLDGFGVQNQPYALGCVAPSATWAINPGDCDDLDEHRNPGRQELCDGGIDNDCDGLGDLDDPDTQLGVYYFDGDGDGFGDPAVQLAECGLPPGYVSNPDDCDDTDDAVTDGDATAYPDADGDGFPDLDLAQSFCVIPSGYITLPEPIDPALHDCDDEDVLRSPGRAEACGDSIDNDCDGFVDDDDPEGALGAWSVFIDGDGDSFLGTPGFQCTPPDADALIATDCDDHDAGVGAATAFYADVDGDDLGADDDVVFSCLAPAGRVSVAGDCNDDDDRITSSSQPLLVPLSMTLDDALAGACDGQLVVLSGDASVNDVAMHSASAVELIGNGWQVDVLGTIQVATGALTARDVAWRGSGNEVAIHVSGGFLNLENSELRDLGIGVDVGIAGLANLENVYGEDNTTALRVEGTAFLEGVAFVGSTQALEVSGLIFAHGFTSSTTVPVSTHVVVDGMGRVELTSFELDGGQSVASLGSNSTLSLTAGTVHGMDAGVVASSGSTVDLYQTAFYDISGTHFEIPTLSELFIDQTTIAAGQGDWIVGDGSLDIQNSIVMGHDPSAGVEITATVAQANNAIHPDFEGVLINSLGAHATFDKTSFFRWGEAGCEQESASFDLHPLPLSPYYLTHFDLGWTGGLDNPERAWGQLQDGLPAGFRAQFGFIDAAGADIDTDQLGAGEELIEGTDPTNPNTNYIEDVDDIASASPDECAYAI